MTQWYKSRVQRSIATESLFETFTKPNLTLPLEIKEHSTKSLQGAADKVIENRAV
jgi:hypothetical protein